MFSEEQIIEELKKADDSKSHTLLLDVEGNFRAIPTDNCKGFEYIGSIDSVDYGGGYVGESAAKDMGWVNECFEECKKVYARYTADEKIYTLL